MESESTRWVEVSPSRYAHEREGLDHVREQLPDADPYHAWSNVEFVALDGTPYEVDLVVLGPAGFHLVELKRWSGKIEGDEREWLEHNPGAGRPLPRRSPLWLTRTKAQAFRSWLEHHARKQRGAVSVPYVHESLFLHGHGVDCRLPPRVKTHVFGREDADGNGLRRIVTDRLAAGPDGRGAVDGAQARALAALVQSAGLRRRRPVAEVRVGGRRRPTRSRMRSCWQGRASCWGRGEWSPRWTRGCVTGRGRRATTAAALLRRSRSLLSCCSAGRRVR